MSYLGAVPSGLAVPVLREAFGTLVFESQVTPRISVNDPFGPTPPSLIGSLVRPRVTLEGKLGHQVIEPWGPPAPWAFPVAVALVVGTLVGIGYLIGRRK